MTNNDLVDRFVVDFAELHANIEETEFPTIGQKNQAERLADAAHNILNVLWQHCGDAGVVKPFDGTNKPKP